MSNSEKHRIMTHMVAFYPDREQSLQVARALIDGGASYIELQFPFSDPTADGPVIQAACGRALEAGFSLHEGFELAESIASMGDVPVFIMTYANPVIAMGMEAFIRRALKAGVEGLIVPDLVPGADEGLYAAGMTAGMPIVPVVVPTISGDRLDEIASLKEKYLYVALRSGITGRETRISPEIISFLDACSGTGMLSFGGFGIRNAEQIAALQPHVHAPVIGSALVEVITQHSGENADSIYTAVRDFTRRLCGE
ncbi:tryptophan synthase subunit alpha [Marispirochaeta aestuarii]|uniref:tryptophan synthase subunit alpha n=1 Tax=Marispirochaeta aestuarii TaxID=1963862 RepID=UPI0029C8D78D|nr:tryptophan synthase subunit alpha [Marispirochaeta aestuarii]